VGKKTYTVEQIIGKLREAEVAIGKGLTVPEAARRVGLRSRRFIGGGRSTEGCVWTRRHG